jgi:catecholate siderophore receptor
MPEATLAHNRPSNEPALLPLGALMLAASTGAWAQTAAQPAPTLSTVVVQEKAEAPQGKDTLRTTTTTIGKGNQQLRDIPQSITVVTEKLIDDRNLDTMKEALRNTAGITFQAAEGGEEDIRLRGFSLQGTGDIFLDGMRDPAFYDRDTFNQDRIEVMRGSASMLFGRGSTGGAVNQVSKVPRLMTEHEVTTTVGSHNYGRLTGDFNIHTGENAALRLNVMKTKADNNGSGSSIDKEGIAGAYRWGIGTADEFLVSLYSLNNNNGINYGLPWIRPRASDTTAANTVIPGLDPTAYFGMASDYNAGMAKMATASHLHRFSDGSELRTQVRKGAFERDLRASAIRFVSTTAAIENLSPATVLRRGTNLKIQDVDTLHAQSDLSTKFSTWGYKHELQTGIDFAHEQKTVYAARSAAQGGVDLTKANTTLGTPDDGAFVNESLRVLRTGNQFDAKAWGAYVQDLVQIAPAWKILAGLRYDNLDGNYDQFNIPSNAAGPTTTTSYQQKISNWSKRFGVLYQPDATHSYHFSYGTSFNTSGDTYSYNAQSANTPPEQSANFELGAKIDSADKRFSTRFAIFHAIKKNERNTDVDTAGSRLLLSGERHATGFEVDLVGRLTPKWEVFGSYTWIPEAKVDKAAPCPTTGACLQGTVGNREGDRPGLSPRHSGTVWTTYQLTPKWRVGGGLNFRSKQAPADVTAPAWEAPGFVTADLMAEYAINEQFTLKGNVTNVANKYYADSLYRGHYVPGAGRLVQVSLSARF